MTPRSEVYNGRDIHLTEDIFGLNSFFDSNVQLYTFHMQDPLKLQKVYITKQSHPCLNSYKNGNIYRSIEHEGFASSVLEHVA